MVDLGAGISPHADTAIEPGPGRVERTGYVGGELVAVMIADFADNLAGELFARSLGDDIDDAARRTLSVEDGRRATQDFDLFDRVNVGPGIVVAAEQGLEAVAIFWRAQAADLDRVDPGGDAVGVTDDTGGIQNRIGQVDGAALKDLIQGFNRHRARRLDDRRVRLGGRIAAEHTVDGDHILIGPGVLREGSRHQSGRESGGEQAQASDRRRAPDLIETQHEFPNTSE